MKKRIMSLALAAAMSVSTLVGGVSVQAETAIDTSKEVELKVLMLSQKANDWEDVWAKINEGLKEKINATVKVDYLSWAEYQEKYPLVLNSGESYDLVYTSSWCFYKEMVQKEVFTELTDEMLSTYMPMTWERTTEDQWASMNIGGSVYAVPFTQPQDDNRMCAIIRGDLREKYNIPEVTNMEGFLEYLKTIAAQEEEMMAYNCGSGDGATMLLRSLTNREGLWWLNLNNNHTYTWIDTKASEESKELVLVDPLSHEGLMNVYKTMAELRQAGVWSQNVLTNDTMVDTAFENGASASYVRITPNVMPTFSKINALHPEWKLEIVDLVVDAETFEQHYSSANGNGYAVPLTAKNPERALMALDLLKYDRELNDLASLGIEGVHWTAVGDNMYEVTEKSVDYPYGDGAMSYGLHTEETRTAAGYPDYVQAILDDVFSTGSSPLIYNFNFNTEPVKSEYAACSAISDEYALILINGLSDDVEGTVTEYKEKMEAAGWQKVLDEYSAQVKDFYASFE